MYKLVPENSFLDEAKKAKFKPNVVLQLLIFVAVFFITAIASVFPYVFVMMLTPLNDVANSLFQLFSTAIVTVLVIVYCVFIEGRSIRSMGLAKNNAVKQYLIGMLIGFLQFSLAVLICVVTGQMRYDGVVLGGNILFVILFFFGFMVQGMEEEVFCRGYFMASLSTRVPVIVAIILNSVFFSCLHLLNPGIGVLPFINLILFAIFASIYAIKTNNLWGICAIHSVWNFAQGNFYGILVSGQDMNVSVLKFSSVGQSTLINGGEFGIEGGLACTFVEVLAIVLTLVLVKNKKNDKITAE